MVNQTYDAVLHKSPNLDLLWFVFFSTVCSYSFHWYLSGESLVSSPRVEWLSRHRAFHLVLFFAGLGGCLFFFCRLLPYWRWLAVTALITFLYSAPKVPHPWFRALRKVAVGKTIFLTLVWTYVTAGLPVVLSGVTWSTGIIFFFLSRFFFIYAICIMFDFRDRADDRATGIRSMVTWLSEKGVDRLFFASLLVAAVCSIFLLRSGFSVVGVILLLIPCVVAAAIYNYSKNHFSDYLYYFVIDGLMMFSALLMLVFRI